jgi:hypothetical protein
MSCHGPGGSPEAYLVVSQLIWRSTVSAVQRSPWEQGPCVQGCRYLEIGVPEGRGEGCDR